MQNTGDVSAIFFDLDGTLTDPKEGITGCVQFALENMGETVPTKDELTWCIGPPLAENFTRLIGLSALAKPLAGIGNALVRLACSRTRSTRVSLTC